MKDIFKLAKKIAQGAGAIQRRHLGRIKNIRFKGDINLLTEVDQACEKFIIDKIKAHYPAHDILAEESGTSYSQSSDYRWIIDPLDGTTNYAHGYPFFGVSIGLEYRGKIVCGVVYDPIRDELFSAVKDKGADLNGKPICVSKNQSLKKSLLATGFAYNVHETEIDNLDHFSNFIKTAQAVRRDGTAALDLCYVACGRFDGYWELGLWPWDVAAGYLIVEEAGGRVTQFRGMSFDVYGKEIVASNGLIHDEMKTSLARGKVPKEGQRRQELLNIRKT
ncbi:MAG: inositol monophosphatase [Deltaproteobacteria bacterium RIFCSPHIGHO2_02_FULL_50_15]|nr:MAG: inositol monophosphatase [Deltaproteobacteria bacterium RIFCSPHIGHO2_02_FULL_50_15]